MATEQIQFHRPTGRSLPQPAAGRSGYRDQHIAFKDETLEAALDENTLIAMPVSEILSQFESK